VEDARALTPIALRRKPAYALDRWKQKAGSRLGKSGPTGTTPTSTLQRGYEAAQIGRLRQIGAWPGHI